jgi:hypothetical protein
LVDEDLERILDRLAIGRDLQWAEFRGGVLNASSGETFTR